MRSDKRPPTKTNQETQTITLTGFSTSPNGAQWGCVKLSKQECLLLNKE